MLRYQRIVVLRNSTRSVFSRDVSSELWLTAGSSASTCYAQLICLLTGYKGRASAAGSLQGGALQARRASFAHRRMAHLRRGRMRAGPGMVDIERNSIDNFWHGALFGRATKKVAGVVASVGGRSRHARVVYLDTEELFIRIAPAFSTEAHVAVKIAVLSVLDISTNATFGTVSENSTADLVQCCTGWSFVSGSDTSACRHHYCRVEYRTEHALTSIRVTACLHVGLGHIACHLCQYST
jgi:hypothetical protein